MYIFEKKMFVCVCVYIYIYVKNCCKYKAGDRYCILCIEEELAIAFYNNLQIVSFGFFPTIRIIE